MPDDRHRSRQASLQPGDVLMMCSDGLWAVLPEQALAAAIGGSTVVRAVPELVTCGRRAGRRHSDNVTALAIMWEGDGARPAPATAAMISTSLVPLGAVTTTIHAPRRCRPRRRRRRSTTDEIEKAIAEIRDAIDKSSRLTTQGLKDQPMQHLNTPERPRRRPAARRAHHPPVHQACRRLGADRMRRHQGDLHRQHRRQGAAAS